MDGRDGCAGCATLRLPLSPAADGVVVHVQPDGRRLESRLARDGVQVAGYDIVDVDGAVQAIDIAAAHPMARWG